MWVCPTQMPNQIGHSIYDWEKLANVQKASGLYIIIIRKIIESGGHAYLPRFGNKKNS